MTLGNIHSNIRNRPSSHAWIPIALLPIFPKRVDKITGYSEASQEQECIQVLHRILWDILCPLADFCRPLKVTDGLRMECCDSKIRLCFPVLCSWLADHMENTVIHGIMANRCAICPCPVENLGELPDNPIEYRDHRKYRSLFAKADHESLRADGMKPNNNSLWHLSNLNPPELIRPDILHGIYLGMFTHLMTWLLPFLSELGRLVVFDQIWQSLPPYLGFTVPNKSYRQVTQWTGREMRNLGRIVLAVFAATIRRSADNLRLTPAQTTDANKAIRAVRYLTDFHLLAQYRSHTPQTIGYMRTYLTKFHETKGVFLKYRAGKVQSQKAKLAVKEHSSASRQEISAARTKGTSKTQLNKLSKDLRLEHELLKKDILEEGSHWNFPKMHMLTHYAEQIPKYGQLVQYSTEVGEAYHKPLKDAYRRSNHVNATPQILNTHERDHAFAMREMNIAALNAQKEPDRLIEQSSLRLQGHQPIVDIDQLSKDYGLPDIRIQLLRYFQQNHPLLYNYDQNSPSADYFSIFSAPCEPFFSLHLTLPSFQDETIDHICRATGTCKFRGSNPRADWIWISYITRNRQAVHVLGGLNDLIPARLNCIFKIRVSRGEQVYRLVHITLMSVVGSRTMNNEEGMIRVRLSQPTRNVVVRARDIRGMAHLVPVEPDEVWLVNNRIDLFSWNLLYDNTE